MKNFAAALAALVLGSSLAQAQTQGLIADDYAYLQKLLGLDAQSAVIVELTQNEQNALHSAINDIKLYPESRDLQVKRYLALVYPRECKRWRDANPGHPTGQTCSPVADAAIEPGKEISDRICATCHLFGTDGPSYRAMASERDWNPHKVEHALRHSRSMVPVKLTQEQLDKLAAYINSFKN